MDSWDKTQDIKAGAVSNFLTNAFVILVLMLTAEALWPFLYPDYTYPPEESTIDRVQGTAMVQIVWSGVYGITVLLILPRLKQFFYFITRDKILLLLLIIVLVSVFWSVAPNVTLRKSVAFAGTTLFGTYLAMRYRPIELVRLLALAVGLAAVLSLIVGLALPSYGLDPDTSRGVNWIGIFTQKNQLGRAMALGGIVFLLLAFDDRTRSNRIYRWAIWSGFGLSSLLVFLSNAEGALVDLILIVLLITTFYGVSRTTYPLNIVVLIGAVFVGGSMFAWILLYPESVFDVLGRDASLTGRAYLWPAVLEKIWQRPLLGYGYGAFWLGWRGDSAFVWLQTSPFGLRAVHAHNGALDVWLDLGLLGLATFAAGFLRTFRRALAWGAYSTKTAESLWPIALLTFVFIHQLVESSLRQNSLLWVLYVYVTIFLSLSAQTGNQIQDGSEDSPKGRYQWD
jgi:exopolysaccharide production protein ExoQ